jgi:competence protein ComEC
MTKFGNSLRSATGKFIHPIAVCGLFLISLDQMIVVPIWFVYLLYLGKRERWLFKLALVFMGIVAIRLAVGILTIENHDSDTLEVTVVSCEDTRVIAQAHQRRYQLFFSESQSFIPGDRIRVTGHFFTLTQRYIPHVFDYARYQETLGISGHFSVDSAHFIGHRFHVGIISVMAKRWVKERINPEIVPYVFLFVFGDDADVSKDVVRQSRLLGVSHLFAISGLHLGLIVGMLEWVLRRFFLTRRQHRGIIILFLVLYNFLLGFKISVFRASMLLSCMFIIPKKYHVTRIDVLSFIFLVMIIVRPAMIFNMGFQLSFLLTLVLILGSGFLKGYEQVEKLIRLSLIANAFALPIVVEANQGISGLFLVANVLLGLFIAYVFLPLSFLVIVFPCTGVYLQVMQLFETAISLMSRVGGFVSFSFRSPIFALLYWLGLWGCIISQKIHLRLVCALMLILALACPLMPMAGRERVVVLDVGAGDAIFIESAGCRMLIDTGMPDDYDAVITFLNQENIRRLDLVVITHWHNDHYGELDDILNHFVVDEVIANRTSDLIDHPITVAPKGSTITCGTLAFEVLWSHADHHNENNNALVLYGDIGGDKWLFLSDIEREVETILEKSGNIRADVVKVAHHGSDTSSIPNFIAHVEAHCAIISAAGDTRHRPSNGVIERWRRTAELYTTYEHGSVSVEYRWGRKTVHGYKPELFQTFKRLLHTAFGSENNG